METLQQNEYERNRKEFSPFKTFLSNVKDVLTRKSTPFKKLHLDCKESAHCKEYDIQGIFVK